MRTRLLTTPALLAGLLAASPVFAQTSPATPASASTSQRDVAVEHRITELHTRLKITAAEQKPFDDFASVMRENARRMDELVQKRHQSAATGSAVDQMHSYGDMAQAHSEDMQRLIPAFSTLYDALSPEQKKLADNSFREFAVGPRGARS